MSTNERLLKLATATPATLAKVDAVLNGADTATRAPDPDCRTCTLTEAARRMGISRPTVYRLIQRGAIRTVELNGVCRVSLQSLFDYVANGEKVRGNYNAGSKA